MDLPQAQRIFTEKLRDFCRAHRTGRRVEPALARVALDWELELNRKLEEPQLLQAAETSREVEARAS